MSAHPHGTKSPLRGDKQHIITAAQWLRNQLSRFNLVL
jgi:hypothetical protein